MRGPIATCGCVALIATVGFAAGACDSDDADDTSAESTVELPAESLESSESASTTTASSSKPVEVFDPESDDLCQWVTADDIVEFLTAAGATVDGPATEIEANADDETGWNCAWTLRSGEEIQIGASASRLASSMQNLDMVAEYEAPGQVMSPGAVVSGHPDLSDGVIVENMAFGRFGFFPPGLDGQLNVGIYDSNVTSSFESVVMITGDELLGELGWLTTA